MQLEFNSSDIVDWSCHRLEIEMSYPEMVTGDMGVVVTGGQVGVRRRGTSQKVNFQISSQIPLFYYSPMLVKLAIQLLQCYNVITSISISDSVSLVWPCL